jgi:hypothetical protein
MEINGWSEFYRGFTPPEQKQFEEGLYKSIADQITHDRKREKKVNQRLKDIAEGRIPE